MTHVPHEQDVRQSDRRLALWKAGGTICLAERPITRGGAHLEFTVNRRAAERPGLDVRLTASS